MERARRFAFFRELARAPAPRHLKTKGPTLR